MNKIFKRLTATALAAVTACSAIGLVGGAKQVNLLSETAISATAADIWYPDEEDVFVKRYTNYSQATATLKGAIKARVGESFFVGNGKYKNYRICTSTPVAGLYGNVTLLYDPAKHANLNNATDQQIRAWMLSYLRLTSTLRSMSGINRPVMVIVMDSVSSTPNWNGSYVSMTAGESDLMAQGIASNNTLFTWTLLHETSHAYVSYNDSIFDSTDEVYTNLRALCALRALKRAGITVPNVIDGNNSVTALQSAVHRMEMELDAHPEFKTAQSAKAYVNSHADPTKYFYDMPFLRLGILLQKVNLFNPWNNDYQNNASTINNSMGSGYDSAWNKLYALCISDVNYTGRAFMSGAVSLYNNYAKTMTSKHTHTTTVFESKSKVTYTTKVSPTVLSALKTRHPDSAHCTKALIHGLTTLEFLCGKNNLNTALNSKVPNNNKIDYWSFMKELYVTPW